MNQKSIKLITLIIVLAFITTVVIYPLAFNPIEEDGTPEPQLEGE